MRLNDLLYLIAFCSIMYLSSSIIQAGELKISAETQEVPDVYCEYDNAVHYWRVVLSNGIYGIVKEDENEIIFHKKASRFVPAEYCRIKKDILNKDKSAKTKAAQINLRGLIFEQNYYYENYVSKPDGHPKWTALGMSLTEDLKRITGEDLFTDIEWQEWYQENKDYVRWSDKQEHLVIDEEAKKAGVPTLEYRESHP